MIRRSKTRLTISVDRALYKHIREHYMNDGLSFSKFISYCLCEELKRDGVDTTKLIGTLTKEEEKNG